MPDVTPNSLRGFLIPYTIDSSLIWTSQASYTEQDKKAGTAKPDDISNLILETAGNQSNTVEIKTVKGGTPGERAAFVWKRTTGNSFGQNSVNAIQNTQILAFQSTSPVNNFGAPGALAKSDGKVLVAYQQSGTSNRIAVKVKMEDGTDYGPANTVYDSSLSTVTGVGISPALLELPDNSILCVHWVSYSFTANTANIYVHRSTDNGSNWTQISSGALDVPVSLLNNAINRTKIAYYQGQILLITEIVSTAATHNKNCIFQAVSIDDGCSFTQIGAITDTEDTFEPSLFTVKNGFAVTWISDESKAEFVILPHAYFPFKDHAVLDSRVDITTNDIATESGGSPKNYIAGGSAAWIDDDQNIFVLFTDLTSSTGLGRWFMMISTDNGATWNYAGSLLGSHRQRAATIFFANDSATTLKHVHVVNGGGRNNCFYQWETTPGINDNSVAVFTTGEWSSVLLPEREDDARIFEDVGYNHTYLPIELPANTGDFTKSGGGTEQLESDGLKLTSTTSAGNQVFYEYGIDSTLSGGAIFQIAVKPGLNGNTTAENRSIHVYHSDASNGCNFHFRISLTDILIRDDNGSSNIATFNPPNLQSKGVVLRIAYAMPSAGNWRLSVWYRQDDNSQPVEWVQVVSNQTLTDSAIAAAAYLRFGHLAPSPSGTNMITTFGHVLICDDKLGSVIGYCGKHLYSGFSNPGGLRGRAYPSSGNFVYVNQGLKITTKDGPAYEGDDFTIIPASQYSIDKAFFTSSPTPRNGWRSNSVNSGSVVPESFIPIAIDPNLTTQNSDIGSDLFALHLNNINFRNFTIEGYNASTSSWSVLATIDTSTGNYSFLNMLRSGVTVTASNPNPPILFNHELAGSIVHMDPGSSDVFRRIKTNSEGVLHNTSTARRAVITLENVQAGDPVSGVMKILPKTITAVVSLNGAKYAAFAIRITAQKTIDNDFRIGNLSAGPVHIFAPQYGRGRSVEFTPLTELSEQADGVYRPRVLGPTRRGLQIAWTDPVDMSPMYDNNFNPNYYKAHPSGLAVANMGDLPLSLPGMLTKLDGAKTAIVYLPKIAKFDGSTNVYLIRRESEQMLSLIDGDMSIDHVLGDEFTGDNAGELFRIASITLTEVV